MLKKIYWYLLFCIFVLQAGSQVKFSDLEISADNKLLFNITVDCPGFGSYKSLLAADLNKKEIRQLTFFPERIMYLEDTGQFQIQNRFGVFRTDEQLSAFSSADQFSSFLNSYQIERGKIFPVEYSPDGKYLIYIKVTGLINGNLTLYSIAGKKEFVVSENIELSINSRIALWSADSKFIIYTKEGSLYYYSIEHLNENRVFAENLRKIGQGVLTNVYWGNTNDLYYISEFLIYKIGSREFFTRALYKDILRIGIILGKIPFSFDPNFDSFWIAPDGKKILLNKGGRNLFLYFLNSEDYISTGDIQSLPYLYLPRSTKISNVIWSADDKVTVLARSIEKGVKKTLLYRLSIPASGAIPGFTLVDDKIITGLVLSPDDEKIAILKENGAEIRSYNDWKLIQTISHNTPLAALWKSNSMLFISGVYYTELYDFSTKQSTLIALSQSGEKGYAADGQTVLLKMDNQVYKLDPAKNRWEKATDYNVKEQAAASDSYRAYLTDSTAGVFGNMIMIRNIKADSFGTVPLFDVKKVNQYETMPEKEEKIDFDNFTHGSRVRRREVALTFDVIDSIEGIPIILSVLSDYNLKCTFFINGEAIKRYTGAVKEIADSGHEVGSLFYAYFNMIDTKYNLDKNFIKLGLAINEDDYFNATGRELSLLWHAPYYFINSEIVAASREMGYIYAGRDLDSMDWVTKDISGYTAGIYLSAGKLVERILREKKPGSLIPVMAGIPRGEREDYLFQKLDILINALLNSGYEIVPVSTLIEHAR